MLGSTSTTCFGQTKAFGSPSFSSQQDQSGGFGKGNSLTKPGFAATTRNTPVIWGQKQQRGGSRVVAYKPTFFAEEDGRLLSISAMKDYKDKSHEELRFEDLQLEQPKTTFSSSKNSNPFQFGTSGNGGISTPFNPFLSGSSRIGNPFHSATSATGFSTPSNPFSPITSGIGASTSSNGFSTVSDLFSPSTSGIGVSNPSAPSISFKPFISGTSGIGNLFPSATSATGFSALSNTFSPNTSGIGASTSSNGFPTVSNPFSPSTSGIGVSNPTGPSTSFKPFLSGTSGIGTSNPFPSITSSIGVSTSSNGLSTVSNHFLPSTSGIGATTSSIGVSNSCGPSTSSKPFLSATSNICTSNPFKPFPSGTSSIGASTSLNTPPSITPPFSTDAICVSTAAKPIGSGHNAQATSVSGINSQAATIIQPTPPTTIPNPFGTLPVMTQIPIGRPGTTPSVQYGISSIPASYKPAPVSVSSTLTSCRYLSERRLRLRTRKYHSKIDVPKVPFYTDEEAPSKPKPDTIYIPRENPRALVIHQTEKWYSRAFVSEKGADNEARNMPRFNQAGDYYIEPAIEELAAKERAEPGFCQRVRDFVVGRHDYGCIKFIGETDVRQLDLESIIQFNNREVIVYMDDSKKPPVGQGLNKPAEVMLLNIKCFDKKTGQQCIEGLKADKYKEMLMKKTQDNGAEFVSYNPVNGVWKFKVKHFSQ